MVGLDTLPPPRFDNTNAWSFVMMPYLILSGVGLLAYNLLQPDTGPKLQEARIRSYANSSALATAPRNTSANNSRVTSSNNTRTPNPAQ